MQFPQINANAICGTITTVNSYHKLNYDYVVAFPSKSASASVGRETSNPLFLWITANTCVLVSIDANGNSHPPHDRRSWQTRTAVAGFALPDDTILYGTITDNQMFCIERVVRFQGKDYDNKEINVQEAQTIVRSSSEQPPLIIGFPLRYRNMQHLSSDDTAAYPVGIVHFILSKTKNAFRMVYKQQRSIKSKPLKGAESKPLKGAESKPLKGAEFKPHKTELKSQKTESRQYKLQQNKQEKRMFWIVADRDADSYRMYVRENDAKTSSSNVFDVLDVPDYRASWYLNSLFRNIKENICLDSIVDESDDEDNDDPNRFMKVGACHRIQCQRNLFKRGWAPVLTADSAPIIPPY